MFEDLLSNVTADGCHGIMRREPSFLFSMFGRKPFPIRFKLLRKANILVNASERFIGDPKCNLLGD